MFTNKTVLDHRLIGVQELIDSFMDSVGTITPNYPPQNIIKLDKDKYLLELAVAGFSMDNLSITTQEDVLTIEGKLDNKNEADKTYIHRGIAYRNFKLCFKLADYLKVKSANLLNGILSIELVRVLPESKKLKSIKIENG